jgi:hypothetical protein
MPRLLFRIGSQYVSGWLVEIQALRCANCGNALCLARHENRNGVASLFAYGAKGHTILVHGWAQLRLVIRF